MKVNQQNPKRKSVSFNVIHTFQKQGDSIDKLTTLMDELSSKLEKIVPPNISLKYIKEGTEDVDKDRIDMILEIDPIVEIEFHITVTEIGEIIKTEIIMVMETIGLGMEIIKPIIDKMTGPTIEGKILTKIMATEIVIGVQVENMRGLDIEVPQEIIQQAGTERTKVQIEIEDIGPELPEEKEKGTD